ncbi:hypothetical protein [Hydrogenimonas urashimensis]|uniref:hypothetical protein n=1 Tax=Hydrogenimonas urashimensis TaxID=2740515 RepID=UPI0019164FC3|nr:hypothetical protein [Hydrogenimonas urashimensis]
MHNRFETLRAKCARRRRKSWLKWSGGVVFLLLLAGAGWLYLYKSGDTFLSVGRDAMQEKEGAAVPHPFLKPMKKAEKTEQKRVKRAKVSNPEPSLWQREGEGRLVKGEMRTLTKAEKTASPSPRNLPAAKSAPTAVSAPAVSSEKKAALSEKRAEPAHRRHVKKGAAKNPAAAAPLESATTKPLLQVREVQDLDALIRQHEKFPKYATALKIATIYYAGNDFENAALWARKANLIDRDDEEAWILYAKSEYALGNRARAIRILRLYLDYRDSIKAKSLLLSWRKEEKRSEESKKRGPLNGEKREK